MSSPSFELPPLLSGINDPKDLRNLTLDQLPALASEIRSVLIHSLSETGGHLAPNLGIVELSIALHRVFSTPRDKILFDVSHQAYVHKMLTGRASELHSIRQFGGISGFTKRSESPHDAYGAGHAGTALSAGLGMAAARDMQGDDYHVIAVAGDGAFTCGTTLEALNNISPTTRRFIVILNDNEWSIDRNVGALSQYFAGLQATETFTWLSDKSKRLLERLAGSEAKKQAEKLIVAARGLISPYSFFEHLGLTYYGPIDGHDINKLCKILKIIKMRNEPVILHILTEKGRGYKPALENPSKFHGVGKYNVENGAVRPSSLPTYSEQFARSLIRMAEDDPKITAITAAMPTGTMLNLFREHFPKRFFDVGIAEEHAALFACGMAAQGLKPYVAIYSTFMQRCIDMIEHDAALQKLPVKFCMDRAGLSPDDGPTHHGLFDIAMLRCIPDLLIMQPKDEAELACMLKTMNEYNDGPSAIRYPRGCGRGVAMPKCPTPLPIGKAEVLWEGKDVAIFALGNQCATAEHVRNLLAEQHIDAAVINARFVNPLDTECLRHYAETCPLLCTLEDHVISGGFGSAVLEELNRQNICVPTEVIGWPNEFIEHGSDTILREKHGLTPEAIAERIVSRYRAVCV